MRSSVTLRLATLTVSALFLTALALPLAPAAQHHPAEADRLSQWQFIPGAEAPMVSVFLDWKGVLLMGTDDRPVTYVRSGALYRSSNGGSSWAHALLGGPITHAVHSHLGVLVAAGAALFHSADGLEWTNTTPNIFALGITGLAAERGVVYAMIASYDGGRFIRSGDGGLTWTDLPQPEWGIGTLTMLDGVLFGGNMDGLFRSSDAGLTWQPVTGFPHQPRIGRLAQVDGILFATHFNPNPGLYRSTDRGLTWEFASSGLPNDPYGLLRDITRHQGKLYSSVHGMHVFRGLYVSHDDGLSWSRIVIPGLASQDVTALHSTGSSLLVGSLHGAYRSDDGGTSWSRSDRGASAAIGVSGIHVEGNRIVVGASIGPSWGRGVWWTEDRGTSWTRSPQFPQMHARTFYDSGETLMAAGFGTPRGFIRSTDGGANWTASNGGMWAGTLVYDVIQDGGSLIAGAHDALYRSTDGGSTWTSGEPAGLRSFARQGTALFAAHSGTGALRSLDGGETWSALAQGLTGNAMRGERLVVHDGQLYLGTDGLGVWRLDGDQWTHVGPGAARVREMVSVPGGLIIATADAPYLRFWTGAGAWHPFDQGLMARPVDALVAHGTLLYAGVPQAGLWVRNASAVLAAGGSSDHLQAGVGTAAAPGVGVYPNPTSGMVQIEVSLGEAGPATVELFDVLGRLVTQWSISESETGTWRQAVDASHLAPGLYLVRASSPGGTTTHRLTVAR